MYTDNETVSYLVRRMYAFDYHLNTLLIELSKIIQTHRLIVFVRWLSSEATSTADFLSRDFPPRSRNLARTNLDCQLFPM